MINNSPKHIAHKILMKNKLCSLIDYNDLLHVIEYNQFAIIEYKKHSNSEHVSELIRRLRVENETVQNDSFIYINNNLKFLFINADVSLEDKCALLRHELGHICDPNFKNTAEGYSKIKREEFANDFSFYLKNPGIGFKLKLFMLRKCKLLAGMIALAACILGLSVMIKSSIIQPTKPVTGDVSTYVSSDNTYYVTSSGKKYHIKHCIIIKYKNNLTDIKLNDAINKGYKPCLICIPEE